MDLWSTEKEVVGDANLLLRDENSNYFPLPMVKDAVIENLGNNVAKDGAALEVISENEKDFQGVLISVLLLKVSWRDVHFGSAFGCEIEYLPFDLNDEELEIIWFCRSTFILASFHPLLKPKTSILQRHFIGSASAKSSAKSRDDALLFIIVSYTYIYMALLFHQSSVSSSTSSIGFLSTFDGPKLRNLYKTNSGTAKRYRGCRASWEESRLEERKKAAVDNPSKFKALTEKARKDSERRRRYFGCE
ncbi:hypothetical protein Vadar_012249 [Vaccinium darrowii]|uniref:Uncharacterized protein n=1 Tax=Vaccinium darrowii TaxID=229202 RepID=A0ACB7XI64_9ERIC|nr:hypothetical protein Vadar_012249 [Vaccinium darrowii]